MSNDIELKTFPNNRIDALTMLYLSQQDLRDLAPDQLAEKYNFVYAQIRDGFRTARRY